MKLLLALLIAAPAFAAPSETPPVLEVGSRARVTLLANDTPKVVGSVLSLPADTLVLAAEPDSAPRAIARLDIEKLELSRGLKSSSGKGATIGAVIGMLWLGLSAAAVANVDGPTDDAVAAGFLGGAVGAIGGAGVGALIGSAFRHEQWEKVPPR